MRDQRWLICGGKFNFAVHLLRSSFCSDHAKLARRSWLEKVALGHEALQWGLQRVTAAERCHCAFNLVEALRLKPG